MAEFRYNRRQITGRASKGALPLLVGHIAIVHPGWLYIGWVGTQSAGDFRF